MAVGSAYVVEMDDSETKGSFDESTFRSVAESVIFPASDTRRLISPVLGYSISIPATWQREEASGLWSGRGYWADGDAVDRFEPIQAPYASFIVTAGAVPSATTIERWVADHLPTRREDRTQGDHHHCEYRSSRSVQTLEGGAQAVWGRSIVAGHLGLLRSGCGFVDGAVIVGGRAYVMSSFTGKDLGADLGAFRAVARHDHVRVRRGRSPRHLRVRAIRLLDLGTRDLRRRIRERTVDRGERDRGGRHQRQDLRGPAVQSHLIKDPGRGRTCSPGAPHRSAQQVPLVLRRRLVDAATDRGA